MREVATQAEKLQEERIVMPFCDIHPKSNNDTEQKSHYHLTRKNKPKTINCSSPQRSTKLPGANTGIKGK